MDIENMHPFCLPFGFCHDAASSPDSNERDKIRSKASSPTADDLFRHLNSHQANNNSSSPSSLLNTDDLLIGSLSSLGGAGGGGGGDLESFYSLELDINTDTSDDINFHELDDESDLKAAESALNNGDGDGGNEENNGGGDCDDDDWCYSQFSLFSPPGVSTTTQQQQALRNRKSSSLIIKHGGHHHLFGTHSHLHHHHSSAYHHHAAVFQHVVDPIDIKSSPTLAQLNLNSQDDPTDGLWDTSAPAAATTTTTSSAAAINSNNHHHRNSNSSSSISSNCSNTHSSATHGGSATHATNNNNNLDLLSNCTSISNGTLIANNNLHHHHHRNQLHLASQTQSPTAEMMTSSCGNTCNHLHHQLHHRAHHSLAPYSHLSSISAASSPAASCNQLHQHHHHHHQQQQQQQHLQSSSLTIESGNSCSRQLYGQQPVVAPHSPAASSPQSTCLAVAPFRKTDDLGANFTASTRHSLSATCCHHQQLAANSSNLNQNLLATTQPLGCNENALATRVGPSLKPSATLNQLNQQQQQANPSSTSSNKQVELLEKQLRSASPALVTSSSSPLSSSSSSGNNLTASNAANNAACSTASASSLATATLAAAAATPTGATAAPTATTTGSTQNRIIDNKLKENIEYLTALLCNGNKLEAANASSGNIAVGISNSNSNSSSSSSNNNNNQQPTISSTMARSYATLAHTLSTGPKLLDQQSCLGQHKQHQHHHQQHQQKVVTVGVAGGVQQQSTGSINVQPVTVGANQQQQHAVFFGCHHASSNEASSCLEASGQQQQQLNANQNSLLKRAYPEQHWFKPQQVVESSVSAADSTESPKCQVSDQQLSSEHQVASQCPPQQVCSMNQQQHYPSIQQQQPPVAAGPHRSSELKVLSSLLSSNKQPAAASVVGCSSPGWPQLACHHHHHPAPSGQLQQQPIEPQFQSIPPNGKPITLTPISSHNNPIIAQQEQQQQQQKASEQLQKKARSNSLFVQPASPSASSTASSGGSAATGIGDTNLVGHPVVPIKRQRGSAGASSAAGQQQTNLTPNNNNAAAGSQAKSSSSRSGRPNSMSTDCSLSSHDEGFSSQIDLDDCQDSARESDDDDDVDSDDESFYGDYTNSDLIGASISDNAENKWTLNMGRTRRNGQKRYFWQYNVQSKGPKGTRICSTDDSEDPFVLPEASDPVFSNDCQVEGVKHSGKARRGDGNDLTPNPRKLLMIGLELKKLGKIINELAPVTDLPLNARNKTRKEKNKLASRACRLKKKAQHEANKIKLYGLQREHQQVVLAIYDIRKLLNETLLDRETNKSSNNGKQESKQQLTASSSSVANSNNTSGNDNGNVNSNAKTIAEQCSMKVAGQTSDYVNSVLEKVVSGCIDGGLQT